MKTIFIMTLGGMGAWCTLYAFYWHLLRPVLLFRFYRKISAAIDSLDLQILDGKISPEDQNFKIVKSRGEMASELLGRITLTNVCIAASDLDGKRDPRLTEEDEKLSHAKPILREKAEEIQRCIIGAFACNCPTISFLVLILIASALWFSAAKMLVDRVTDAIWLTRIPQTVHSSNRLISV